ncbi:hypothetical protein [Micromonospora sp. NPDC005710]|uniref:hypothetical protein n=1 Tax=Micromonospora sp. NPDC005710 TaxID=3157051 RepID=UPI0033FF430B
MLSVEVVPGVPAQHRHPPRCGWLIVRGVPSTLWEFQDLFVELRDGLAAGWGGEVLQPWLDRRPHLVAELHELGRPDSRRVRVPREGNHFTALEGLYAFSRIVEVLVSAPQPDNPDPQLLDWTSGMPWWRGTIPGMSAWPAFRAAIRAAPLAKSSFHPFFHEIVSVQVSDDADEPPGEFWPGAIVGSLLVARAGVAIRAGTHHLDADVAARSALYWAWWRRNRRAVDLSHGWGHNSQWSTNFRRDYIAESRLYYNVDADPSRQPDGDLNDADRIDLLRYRCSIRVDLGADQWPFDDTFVEQAP